MPRGQLIPVLLLLWGCGDEKSSAGLKGISGPLIAPTTSVNVLPARHVPLSFRIQLIPAWYGSLPLGATQWELISEKRWSLSIEQFTTNDPPVPQPGPNGWYSFWKDGGANFLIQEKGEDLCIYHPGLLWGFEAFGWVPRLLEEGRTWTSQRVDWSVSTPQSVSCVADGGRLRVDFSESPRLVHSLWFDPVLGLIRWDGIDASPIVLDPGDPTTARLRRAARAFTREDRVDDEDEDEGFPAEYIQRPLRPSMSASGDATTHGGKRVAAYARWRTSYDYVKESDQHDGQFIVLKSWLDGNAREQGPRFIMLKSQGRWLYATATPEGKELTAWGRLRACMKCHEAAATRDCLFGPRLEED